MRIPRAAKLSTLGLAVYGAVLAAPPSLSAEEAWGLKAIRAAEAWPTTRGRSETVIAVIDSGVLEKHEQLEPRIASPRSVFSLTGRQVGGPQEIDHGTAVAVIAAGKTLGVCPACSLMPVHVQVGRSRGILRADKFTTDGSINGIYRAIEAGAKVVNMSIRLGEPVSLYRKGGPLYRALSVPFRAAEEAGITVVVAAGNEGADIEDSAKGNRYCNNPYTLCVGGIGLDPSGKVVPYKDSNHGPGVDVSAPAVEIHTGAADSRRAYVRVPSGTSLAAPHVAGLAGLIVSAKPDLHPRDVRYAIIASAAGDKAVEKKLRWAVDEDAQDEELKLWARAYLLLRGETKAPDRVEEKLKQLLLSLIPQAYAERWYYPEVVIPEGGNTIQGKAVGGLVDAPRAIALAKKLTVPVARPALDGEQAKLAASIPAQELVKLYELARLEGSYAGALDPEGLAEIVGPFELRIAKPSDRLEVVRPKSPGKGYSERLEFLAPGSFRHLATLDGKDHGQGTVEVRRFGDFIFVKNPKTGTRMAYESKARVRSVGGIAGGMAKLLAVFDAHPRSVSPYRPAPFCTIAGCEAGVIKIGLFGEYEEKSYSLPGAVSVFAGAKKVAEGSGSGPGFGFVLPSGAYRLRVADPLGPGAEQEIDITVAAGEEVLREVSFPKGFLRIRTLDSAGKPREANVWISSGKKELTYSWGGTQFGFFLSAGTYTARVEDREPGSAVRTNLDVTIETGKALSREVKLARGTLHLRTFETGGKPLATRAKIFRGDTLWETKNENREMELALPPGAYRVVVQEYMMSLRAGDNAPSAEAVVTIEDGKTTARDLTVPGGTLTLRSLLPDGKPVETRLSVLSGEKEVFYTSGTRSEKLFLAPGDYRIKIEKKTGSATMEAEAQAKVEDGKSVQQDLTLPAGVLSIRSVDRAGKPVRADLRLYSGDKHLTTKYGDTTFEMLLPPGRYRAQLTDSSDSKRKEELEVTIEEGKTLARDVVFGR